MRLALRVHSRPFSVTSEESLRSDTDSENHHLMDTRAPRDRRLHEVKLVLVH